MHYVHICAVHFKSRSVIFQQMVLKQLKRKHILKHTFVRGVMKGGVTLYTVYFFIVKTKWNNFSA